MDFLLGKKEVKVEEEITNGVKKIDLSLSPQKLVLDSFEKSKEPETPFSRMLAHVMNKDIYDKPKPPRESYFYFPNKEEQVDTESSKIVRRIFEGNTEDEFLEDEKKHFKQLYIDIDNFNLAKKNANDLFKEPENWNKFNNLRFHQATNYNSKQTIDSLMVHFKWLEKAKKIEYTKNILEILNSGCLYVHGRDSKFRPLVVCDVDKFMSLTTTYSNEDFEHAAIKLCDYIIEKLLVPGQVENWVLIVNMGNVSVFSIPDNLKNLMTMMQDNYRARLYRSYIIGMSTFMTFLWNIIKLFLDAVTVKKFVFLKESTLNTMHSIINPDQLEKRFGGNAENAKDKYLFPPIVPSENYLLKSDVVHKVLISDKEYRVLVQKDSRVTKSPYIYKVFFYD